MANVVKSVLIDAPAEKVFAFMNEPANLPEIWPNLVAVKDVQVLPNGGASFRFVYTVAGIRLESFSEDTEYLLNQRTVSKSSGGIEGWATFMYEPTNEGTKVTYESEYKIPIPLVGKLAENMIIKLTEQDMETLLINLKARMEA